MIRERIRNRIESAGNPPALDVGEDRILAARTLAEFYRRRAFQPAWRGATGVTHLADSLLAAVQGADDEGLTPGDYHADEIAAHLAQARTGPAGSQLGFAVDLELLLSDAFLMYGSHCLAGRLNPETIDPEWFANRRNLDLATVLEEARRSSRIREALAGLLPPQADYARLRDALRYHREQAAAGGWPTVPDGPKLEVGARDPRVGALRRRLAATGDDASNLAAEADLFDEELDAAVRRFQKRHGLDADGVVGPMTLAALNTTAEERARQIEVNMERWRWLPQELGARHLLVNIADFHLDVVERGATVMTQRVIVGRSARRTPVFSARMTYLVFNPRWEVPRKLAVEDKLPLIKKDPTYLSRLGFKVLSGWGADEKELDPAGIDWSRLSTNNFPYRLRQVPGPDNALGKIKFMFPNPHSVYLHDTPSRELFARTSRAFSSGCIRIERPFDLAEYLLASDSRWTRGAIEDAVRSGREQTVTLPEPIPVHILYWTSWVSPDGTIQFRDDLYDRDARVALALSEAPPEPE